LGVTDVDLKALKRAVVETLEQPGGEEEKRSCIELLTQIDPKNVGEVLAPLLDSLSPVLQRQSLETMLQHPNPRIFTSCPRTFAAILAAGGAGLGFALHLADGS
jgi:hypothetical protein